MSHTLITFLGSVPSSHDRQYRETCYALDGQQFRCRFLGTGLAEALHVDRVRILGTAGSMWDVLADELGATGDAEAWVRLADAVALNQVSAELLQSIEEQLNAARACPQFELRLIPYGYQETAQVDIMRALSEGLERGSHEVTLDITHGFCHLPALGLLGMFYMNAMGHTRLLSIYYAAFRPDQDETRVVNLSGLLHIQEWVRCLDQFGKDGDYSVFAELLTREGMRGDLLAEAAFLERTGNLSMAKKKLDSFWNLKVPPHTPACQMFWPLLEKRLRWRLGSKHWELERKLAQEFLTRKDYLRAAIFIYESRISQQVELVGGSVQNYDVDRARAEAELKQDTKSNRHVFSNAQNFFTLKGVRNRLAHGVRSKVDSPDGMTQKTAEFIESLASDEKRLHDWLTAALK